ncbi:hypothetical protein ACFP81_15100 [Deinococcus lacus]|uniref:Uncharacterized protein n=1 Tax=Deinococcus lacus TaxID=392561 RepID=A0ABW1YJD6_9DEIO
MADEWLARGWNVGIFHWTQLADDEGTFFMPFNAQAKIWTADYTQNNGTRIGMRYRDASGATARAEPARSARARCFIRRIEAP